MHDSDLSLTIRALKSIVARKEKGYLTVEDAEYCCTIAAVTLSELDTEEASPS